MEDTTLRTLTLIQKTLDSKLEKSNDIKYFNTIKDIPIEDQTFFQNLIDNKLLIDSINTIGEKPNGRRKEHRG